MARSRGPLTLCAAALLLCTVTTVNCDKCRTGCGGVTPNIFKYQDGTTYKYNLDSNIDISISSAENQHTSTKLTGTVLLTQQPNCNQVLRLQNVQVVGPDAKKYGNLANIDKSITLNFHDGHVEDEICAEPGDTQNSLNIKRAVASMFQAALKHHEESDIFGKCPSDITSRKDGNTLFIHKTRDLTQCSHRESIKEDFMSTSFNLKAVQGSSPIFSNFESEQRVKNGIMEHVLVTENYLYKPLSDGKSHGVKAIVTTKLTLAGQSKEKVPAKATEPKSIFFENPHQETTKSANVDSILNALKETKNSMDISVTEKSAGTFYRLIKILRASRKDDILAVYGQVKTGAGGFKDKAGARKVFFDALFRVGTGEGVEVVVELLKNKELSPLEQKLVYLSFSFIRHATKGSLHSATVLLDQPDLPREAYLGIGSLAGRYCSEHPCDNVDELNKLMQKLTTKLTAAPANRKAENEVVAVLKGLGNVHHLSDAVVDKLVQIINEKKAPSRLRVAALETALTDACKPKLINAALNILKNRQEDSEIRIKAYLVVAECPDNKVATVLKELLDTEPVYQVGGFIVSHLRNLRNSANPDREHAKQFLSTVRTTKKFPIDPRKYSFNNELSYNFDAAGTGNSLESNVIYSQNSFLPRSVNLNLTTEMFGHSFNFLEIGSRQENLDKVLEHYFGPLGVLSHSPEELYSSGKESVNKIVEHIKHRMEKTRGKRDVSRNEIDTFAKTVKILGNELNKDFDFDLSVKIFGSEMLFLSINEDIQKLTPDAIIDNLFDHLDSCIDKAKNFEYHLKNHMLFTDVEVSYPTALGFPLRFTLQGSAAMHFITSGNVDIHQILKDPKNAQLKLNIIPSANIEISGGIQVDAHFVQTGLKITTNVLTSTGGDLSVKLLDDKGIDVKFGLPVENQKILSFSHTVELTSQELGKSEVPTQLKFKDKPKEMSICFDQLSPMIGLSFCGDVLLPSTLSTNHVGFPLNGNIKLEASIQREDVTEYHFKALLKDTSPKYTAVEITFETPGSKTDRHVSLLLEATTEPNRALKATLKSPIKQAIAEAVITDNVQEKSAMVRFQYDTQEYLAKIGVSVSGNDAKQIYKPLIEYHTPGDVVKTKGNRRPDYSVEGQVIVDAEGDKRKFTFDHVKIITPDQPPVEINGYLEREGHTKYGADLKVKRDSVNVAAKGKLQFGPGALKLNAEVQNTVNPNANFNFKLDMKKGDHEYENSIVVIHGSDLSSKKHCLTIINAAKYQFTDKDHYDFGMKNKVTYPLLGIEGKLDAHANKKHISYDFTVAYDKFKLESELDAKLAAKQIGDYDVKFEIGMMNNKIELKAKRDINGEKSTVHNALDISGRKYQLDGTVTHHCKPNDINIGTDLTLKIHGKPDDIKIDTGLISNHQQLDSHAKITDGSTPTIDIVIKGVRGANPNGNLKVFVKDLVDANGNFKVTGGKGTGHIVLAFPKIDRKMKAEGTFTCQDPTHNAVLNVFFDFEKDNTKKLHFETNNQITKTSFDTKNKLEVMSQKLEVNAKGNMEGKFMDGKITGDFEVTLPNHHIYSGSVNRQIHTVEGVSNGNVHLLIEHRSAKDAAPCKLDVKAAAKDTDFKRKVFDITYNIAVERSNGKNILADITVKHNHDGDKHNSHIKTKFHGSLLPHPLELETDSQYSKVEGTHKGSIGYGSNLGAKLTTKYNLPGRASPNSGGLDLELILPNDKYKNIKLQMNGKALLPHQNDAHIEADGSIVGILNNEKTAKLHGNVKASKHDGQYLVELTLPNEDPLGLSGNYKLEKTESGGKAHGEIDLKFAKDKEVKAGLTINKLNNDEMDFEIDLITPSEKAKHINLQVKNKKSSDGHHLNNEVILTADQKHYSLTNELIISETNPSLDIQVKCPDGKASRIYATFNRVAPKQYTGEVKVESIKDFNLEASGDATLESVDNFHITINVHSEKLHLDQVKFEALNKPSKSGKRIQFSAKSGDKNLISGSTSYKANEEGGKFIVEGSGTVKVKEETKTATFKYMKQQLQQAKDGEQGIEILLNAGIGNKGIVGELKLTNKQFRLLNSYCEEKKQCAHVEVFSKTNTVDAAEFNNELEINVDLRKLGLSHEFGLKSVTNRKNFILDHTVDVHFESSANSKYQYSLYVHPKEAGIQFTTPKRVVSLEAKGDVTHSKPKTGTIKAEVALYMNKQAEPNKKTVISYSCDHSVEDNSGHADIEIKFSNSAINKDLSVQYHSKYDVPARLAEITMDLDIFAKKNQKITFVAKMQGEKLEHGYKLLTDGSVVSKGMNMDIKFSEKFVLQPQNLDYDLQLHYQLDKSKHNSALVAKVNAKEIELLAKIMNRNLFHIESAMQLSKQSQVIDTKICLIGIEDMVTHTEVKNFNTFIFTLAKKAAPQNKLKVSSGLIMGQIADFRVECEKAGAKTDVLHASIKLDETNFMKPDFGINSEYIQNTIVPAIQNDNAKIVQNLKAAAEEYQKGISTEIQHMSELAKKSAPNLKPVADYYKQELIKIKEELISDKTIQEISEFMKKIFGAVAGTISEIYSKLNDISEKLIAISSENFAKITDIIAKDILPTIRDVGGKILDVYLSIMKSLYDLAMIYIVKFAEILKAHQAELKHVATVLSEAFQDVGRLFIKFFNQIRDDLAVLLKNLYDQIKALPIFDQLQESYKEYMNGMPVPEQVVNVMNDVCGTIKELMPTEELKQFVSVLQDYVGKKLRQEAVDDSESLKQIYNSLMKAINSIIKFLEDQQNEHGEYSSILENALPVRLDRFYSIPKLAAIRISPLTMLMSGDLPSIRQYLTGSSLNPRDFIPPFTHHAVIVQGQHIFTFDNRHLTFPGQCNYVLVKDAVNSNFTLVGQYKDGHLEAITFSDRHDTITLKKDQGVVVNGAAGELPIRHKELEVFRLYETVNIISKAGIYIIAEPELHAIGIYVNGFYHGQLRGLLGNGNNEPFDDFTLPNGKISSNEADLGNAYKLNAGCAAVKTVDHHAHHAHPKCDELFGHDSELHVCYPFVDPHGYQQACEHGLASGDADTEKFIVAAYVAECRSRKVLLELPAQYLQCTNSEKPFHVDDQFSVKVPGKSADIIVVVEQNKDNEAIFKELVQPVITQVSNELNAKGITDIEFSLIGFGGEYQKYPSHYTNGGKLAFHGKAGTLKFADAQPRKPIDSGCKRIDDFLERVLHIVDEVKYQMTIIPEAEALREALKYPFRSHAVKTILLVKGHTDFKFSPMFALSKYWSIFSRKDGIHMNLIMPLDALKLTGKDAKQVKNIVGFNDHSAFTLGDAKKKGDGSAELRRDVDYGMNYGADYFLERHGGNVFASNNFAQAKGGQKKQFIQVVSHVISEDMVNTEYGYDCHCKRTTAFDAKNVCVVATIKEKEPRKGGVKG